ncbi:MAG: YibE/F family protein, partial [Actinomycetota bacterium]|nr:YibE/F family protein [Actinomycetota bacterium]
ILLLFSVSDQSLADVANTEVVAVEIIRTLCGSIGLVAAVPLTTAMAAVVVTGAASPGGPPLDSSITEEPTPRWEDFGPDEVEE